jgi:hypothetical protein
VSLQGLLLESIHQVHFFLIRKIRFRLFFDTRSHDVNDSETSALDNLHDFLIYHQRVLDFRQDNAADATLLGFPVVWHEVDFGDALAFLIDEVTRLDDFSLEKWADPSNVFLDIFDLTLQNVD